ncbi:FAD-binding domain-containing protein [Fusarium denticulatum]|uniref:FAD-binding domain-containing protein n=1 Tax=Fusarium denticulatum TaxID=48507 RepID=A0A8H5XH18_9HYPO|nr:FAD-binding domain-containing protein [Fusarium denticulatum]
MEASIQTLKAQEVPILERGQPEYDKAIATSNLLFRFSRPEFVARPETPAHVQAVIKEAKAKKLKVTIKCNGHSYAGHSTAEEGISLDLRSMKKVALDMNTKTVTFDAGCQWGHVYGTLINGGHDGFIINGGRCPTVGVSGFILGSGLGPFTRTFGMGSDTLVEATLVTADGDLVTVSERDPPGSDEARLFWALRGAGGGNFGVMVSLKLRVQQLNSQGGMVTAGRYQWFPENGFTDDVMKTMDDFYVTDWPTNLTIDSTWICDLRQSNKGGVRFTIAFDGSKEEYDGIIDKYIKNTELSTQLKRRVLPEKSTRFLYETLVGQWLEETQRAYPANASYELYSSFIFTNKDPAILKKVTTATRELMAEFRKKFAGENVNFLVTWIHSGGKAAEKKPTDTAFFWRSAVFHTYVTVEWTDKWMERDMRGFIAKVKQALRPLSVSGVASFVNFPDRDVAEAIHERAYFGDNYEELRKIKKIWDPDNFFDWVQGVRLPGAPIDKGKLTVNPDEEEDRTDEIAGEQWKKWSEWKMYKSSDWQKDLDMLADMGY